MKLEEMSIGDLYVLGNHIAHSFYLDDEEKEEANQIFKKIEAVFYNKLEKILKELKEEKA